MRAGASKQGRFPQEDFTVRAIRPKIWVVFLSLVAVLGFIAKRPAAGQSSDKEAELARGKKVFNQCKACHTLEKNGPSDAGPNLYGVVGRRAATLENYTYSDAMKASKVTWDAESLDSYLKSPAEFVPGTDMAYAGMKNPDDRKAVIEFLKAQGSSTASKP
jgi:cytochrome c